MKYDENMKNASLRYKRTKQHPVTLSYKKDVFESEIAPAIKRSGMPVATFIKVAIKEKIQRDGLGNHYSTSEGLSSEQHNDLE